MVDKWIKLTYEQEQEIQEFLASEGIHKNDNKFFALLAEPLMNCGEMSIHLLTAHQYKELHKKIKKLKIK